MGYYSGSPKCGEGGGSPSQIEIKKTVFLDKMVSRVLRDLPFNRNQPLKTADDLYIRILKNKTKISHGVLDEIKKTPMQI
jgi:hypothetical protein